MKAAYALETTNYNDFIILNGGVRFDDYQISASNNVGSVKANSNLVNYNLGAVVKPLPNVSVYGAYATSADPVGAGFRRHLRLHYGGLNPSTTINQIFGPQTSQAEEAGTKWEFFGGWLLATGALFQTDVQNARETILTGLPNAGQTAARRSLSRPWHRHRPHRQDHRSLKRLWWLGADEHEGAAVHRANQCRSASLAFIANQSFNLLTKYKINDMFEIGGQATYRSKIYGGTLLVANAGTVLPDYWRFDSFLEAKINKNLTMKVVATNIFNALYYDSFYQSTAPFVMVAPGRRRVRWSQMRNSEGLNAGLRSRCVEQG